MRLVLAAVLTALCACAPAPTPVEPAPPPAPAPVVPEKRDYDVLLDVSADLSVRARLFPDAPVVGVEVLAFSSADATPVIAWSASMSGDAAAIPAGVATTLGALPTGWTETKPFVAPEPGVTWVVTLTAADGTGRASRFLTDTRVRPTLQVDRGAGLVVVQTVPSVAVARVTLFGNDGGVLWEGRAPVPEGVSLPSGGLLVGDAPSTWDALRFPTNANLVSGQRYHLEVAVPGDALVEAQVLAQDVLFVGGEQPSLQPIKEQPISLGESSSNLSANAGRVFETNGGGANAFQTAYATSPTDPVTYAFEATGFSASSRPFLDLTPMTGDTGASSTAPMNTMRTLWALSKPVNFEAKRAGFAAVFSSSRAVPGQLMVVERQPGSFPFNIGGNSWDSGWNLVSTPLGPSPSTLTDLSTHLSRGLVTGLSQSADHPWIVSLTNVAKPTDRIFAYVGAAGGWSNLTISGLAPVGNTLVTVYRLQHLVGSDGVLYAFALIRSTDAANVTVTELVLARFLPSETRWERLNAAPSNVWAQADDDASFHLAEQGGALAATALSLTPDNKAAYYAVLRSASGVIMQRYFGLGELDPAGRSVRIRDLAFDARGQVLLLSFAKVILGDQGGSTSALVSVLSRDSNGLGLSLLVESPLSGVITGGPDVRFTEVTDLSFAPQARAVLALTSGLHFEWRNNIRYTTPYSLLWRMPLR